MSRFDAEQTIFRINLILLAIIFFFLAPSTHVFKTWFPDKSDALWLIPIFFTGVTAGLWFLFRLAIPVLIRINLYQDKRQSESRRTLRGGERLMRIGLPMIILTGQILILTAICAMLISAMRGYSFDDFLSHLPYSNASMRKQMHS